MSQQRVSQSILLLLLLQQRLRYWTAAAELVRCCYVCCCSCCGCCFPSSPGPTRQHSRSSLESLASAAQAVIALPSCVPPFAMHASFCSWFFPFQPLVRIERLVVPSPCHKQLWPSAQLPYHYCCFGSRRRVGCVVVCVVLLVLLLRCAVLCCAEITPQGAQHESTARHT